MLYRFTTICFSILLCLFSILVNGQAVISSINPDSAYQGQQNLQVTISGTNFDFGQTSSVMAWMKQGNDSIVGNNTYVSTTESALSGFSFSLSASTGLYDVYFQNSQNFVSMFQNGFHLLAAQPLPAAPDLIYPDANAILNNTIVSFDWNDVQNAVEYELIIDNDISFASPIVNIQNLSVSNSFPGVSFYTETYYWKVRAKNSSELWSNWSSVYIFTISITSVPQLTSVNPDNGYAGQTNLGVTVTGQNTHFTQGSSTIDFHLKQNAYTITPLTQSSTQLNADLNFNISPTALLGLYDVIYYTPQDDSIALYNSFYIHGGNQYSGNVFFDANNNQVFDNGEIPYPNAVISVFPLNYYTISQSDGSFIGYVPAGAYTLNAPNTPNYFTVSPSQHPLSFSGSGGTDSGNNFALQAIPGIHDLNIGLTSNNDGQPGEDSKITITVNNTGPVAESGDITFTFPDEAIFDSTSNTNYSLNGNTLTWNYSNLQPFSNLQIIFYFTSSITTNLGDILVFNTTVNGISEDYTPNDNHYQLDFKISNSFDPNIKEVFPELGLTPQQATDREYLEYTIHFQNTGNAPAINIRILDTLNAYLDIGSFQMLAASHAYQVRLLENNLVEFRFNDIYLPDSTSNEPMSHGFIKYKIKPSSSFTTGIDITNTAHIYFDYNEAIVTNTTHTQIITDVNEHAFSQNELSVMPNPFNSTANILYNIAQDGFVEIKLYDYKGQLITVLFGGKKSKGEHKLLLNGNNLSSGVYFISLVSNGITDFKKVVLINTGRP